MFALLLSASAQQILQAQLLQLLHQQLAIYAQEKI